MEKISILISTILMRKSRKPKAKKAKKLKPSLGKDSNRAAEIPFTFKIPETYEELSEHFSGRTPEQKATIVDRIIKCNHPQFGGNNNAGMEVLFRLLLQHLHDCGTVDEEDVVDGLDTVARITPFMFDLCKFNPAPCAKAVLSVVNEKYQDYCKRPRCFPTLESVRYFLRFGFRLGF